MCSQNALLLFFYRLISFFHLELKKKKKTSEIVFMIKVDLFNGNCAHLSQRKITCKCTLHVSLVVPWDTWAICQYDELEILLKFEASLGNIHVFTCCSCYHVSLIFVNMYCSFPLANVPNVYNVVYGTHIMTFGFQCKLLLAIPAYL